MSGRWEGTLDSVGFSLYNVNVQCVHYVHSDKKGGTN